MKGDVGTIGLTDDAQCQLGDIVFVELPGVGTGAQKLASRSGLSNR